MNSKEVKTLKSIKALLLAGDTQLAIKSIDVLLLPPIDPKAREYKVSAGYMNDKYAKMVMGRPVNLGIEGYEFFTYKVSKEIGYGIIEVRSGQAVRFGTTVEGAMAEAKELILKHGIAVLEEMVAKEEKKLATLPLRTEGID